MGQVARVLWIEAAIGRLRAAGETQQKIADAFQSNHEFHAGEQFASFRLGYLGDGEGNTIVDLLVQGVELFLFIPQAIQQRR